VACELQFNCEDGDLCTADSCHVGECDAITCENELVVDDCVDLIFDGLCPILEDNPKGLLLLNDNDDNGNGVPDLSEQGVDPDVVTLKVQADPALTGTVELSLVSGAGRVKIYETENRSNQIMLPST